MRKLKTRNWLLSLATMLGAASATYAQENQYIERADAIFGATEQPLIQQIGHNECSVICDGTIAGDCDTVGCGSGYLFGSDEAWDLGNALFAADSGWDIGGWTQWGYTNRSTGMFNSNPNRFVNNQSWLFIEKVADGSKGIDFGGRIDLMYGTDADDTQAFGNPPGTYDYLNGWDHGIYGWALPQLYAEVAAGDLSVKIGHFYTLLGYEVVGAPGNFFYSHAFTMYNSEAFTHTGAVAIYNASDNVTLYGGWTLGWDTGFNQWGGGSSFLGGASVGITDDLTVTYILTAGDLGFIGDGYSHSIVADWNITDKLEYVFQSDLVSVNGDAGAGTGHYHTIGINQYLFYWFNDQIGVGGRAEWWKANGESIYEITGGLNVKPMANLTIRPEIRYQWGSPTNAAGVPVDEGGIFGIDAYLTF